jgi:hypothetical protein
MNADSRAGLDPTMGFPQLRGQTPVFPLKGV